MRVSETIQRFKEYSWQSADVTPTAVDGPLRRLWSVVRTRSNLARNRKRLNRRLEIGPGPARLPGFETLNCSFGRNVDYVWDASKTLPFSENTFELIYASHVLEHFAWYHTEKVLSEWRRILKPGGVLEVWVPNGLKICKAFVDAETLGHDPLVVDPWTRFNANRDPCVWASGRTYTYGDGTGSINNPNWHRALFSPRYLQVVLEMAGFRNVKLLDPKHVRGHDHGWINLGMRGTNPCVPVSTETNPPPDGA
jgi:SAM-dependent methyltransferase